MRPSKAPKAKGPTSTFSDLPGPRVALVTGATGAIGEAIALGLAAQEQFQVVLTARDEQKARKTVSKIEAAAPTAKVRFELVDLGRRSQVEALAQRWRGPLHVLVNNAAITPEQREETPEGLERQFATNVLGYLWMSLAFEPILQACRPARIVNVASYWAGGLDMDDLQFEQRPYDNDAAYRQSKQANRMLSAALARAMQSKGITVNSCHPGDVRSNLSTSLGFGGHETPEQAAATPIWLATAQVGETATGQYFAHRRAERCRFSEDIPETEALLRLCESI